MNSDEFGIRPLLAILQQHRDHFTQIGIEFLQRFTLRVCAGKPGYESDVQSRAGTTFDDGRVGTHGFDQSWMRGILRPRAALRNLVRLSPPVGEPPSDGRTLGIGHLRHVAGRHDPEFDDLLVDQRGVPAMSYMQPPDGYSGPMLW